MIRPSKRRAPPLLALLVVLGALLALAVQSNADYVYEFHFDELILGNGRYVYTADQFSFTSPALIGPFGLGSFIPEVNLASPLDLNGFTFYDITLAGSHYTGGQLSGLTFSSYDAFPYDAYDVVNFRAIINFSPGSYGPGFYDSVEGFARLIAKDGSPGYNFYYNGGSLTISETSIEPAVPVPGTILLLGSGLLGLGAASWRRRRRD